MYMRSRYDFMASRLQRLTVSVMFSFLQEKEYAIEVVLSDESQYTTYRTIKEIANLNVSLCCMGSESNVVQQLFIMDCTRCLAIMSKDR